MVKAVAASTVPVFQVYRLVGTDAVWWRLISPNGRALAQAPEPLEDLNAAVSRIGHLRSHRDELEPSVRVMPTHRWRWQLQYRGRVVVVASGDQDRRLRCEAAWQGFLAAMETAHLDQSLHAFHRGNRRAESFEVR